MKKITSSILFIGAFAAYVFYSNLMQSQAATTTNTSNPQSNSGSNSSSTASTSASNTLSIVHAASKNTIPTKSGTYTDGTYTGNAVDAYYGTVQVAATIQNGAIASVRFVQYPHDQGNSAQINAHAMPQLIQEAVQTQSANVDGISGATHTTEAFKQSLSSALSQAS